MAHASFSVNEQRGIAMNLRFEEEKKHEQRMQFLKGAIRFLIMVAAVVFLAWLIITFALKKVSVIGSSMETTLYNGEDVIVNKTSYVLFPPKRNQIIAFYPEVQDEEETINSDSMIHIRRVAGLPGEKVQIKNGKLYINYPMMESFKHFKSIPDEDFNNYKIVQISDFHNNQSNTLTNDLIKEIEKQKPNIIVLTGDFIDSSKTYQFRKFHFQNPLHFFLPRNRKLYHFRYRHPKFLKCILQLYLPFLAFVTFQYV